MWDVVGKMGVLLMYTSDEIKNNKGTVCRAVRQDSQTYMFVGNRLQLNKELWRYVLMKKHDLIEYVGKL